MHAVAAYNSELFLSSDEAVVDMQDRELISDLPPGMQNYRH